MSLPLATVLDMAGPWDASPPLSRRVSSALRVIARQFEIADDFLNEPAVLFSDDDLRDALEETHVKRLTIAMEARALAAELEDSSQFDPLEGYGDRIEALLEELQCCEDDEDQLFLSALFHEPHR